MASSTNTSHVDVLIIGSGPSGLMLSTWMARMGIKTRIIDKRFDRINSGQADGIQSRSFEILDSLGIGKPMWEEANHMLEIRFWNPDEQGHLFRSDMIVDTTPGISRFQQATLHQARIEDYLLGYVKKHSDISIEYGLMPESLNIDVSKVELDDAYPVTVTLRQIPPGMDTAAKVKVNGNGNGHSDVPNGLFRSNLATDNNDTVLAQAKSSTSTSLETVHAKYVVGCDGAHSWTRKSIGSVMEGEQTDFIWGVLDIIPITDFPDIRYRCAIHSEHGSMMVIPRENKLVRLYIQVTEVDQDGKAIDRFKITPETLMSTAQRILNPYKFSYKHCHWWTAYRIGQRVGSKFSADSRVFLAGDAVHTHSPKAGQGMNISMHDTYNLGWKLASVIKGHAHRSLLKTYDTERGQIARELIEFDHRFSRLFSGKPAKDLMDSEGIDLKTFKQVFEKGNLFASGIAIDYGASLVTTKQREEHAINQKAEGSKYHATLVTTSPVVAKQNLATKVLVGMRMPSYKVLNQSDARPSHLGELLPSNGSWRVLVFPGNVLDPQQFARYEALGAALGSPESFLHRFTPPNERYDSIFEVITIHSAPRVGVELLSLPDIFHPFSDDLGWDYCKVFVDDVSYHEGHGHAYENYGIDPKTGCVIIVRPDQYVSWIGELEDEPEMTRFFAEFMKQQT